MIFTAGSYVIDHNARASNRVGKGVIRPHRTLRRVASQCQSRVRDKCRDSNRDIQQLARNIQGLRIDIWEEIYRIKLHHSQINLHHRLISRLWIDTERAVDSAL